MEQNGIAPEAETDATEEQIELDPRKLEAFRNQLEVDQNLPKGLLAGLIAAIVGAAIWALITVGTGYQIGWMAIGVGFLVGFVVRQTGKGISMPFGIMGAILALFGCLLGNVLSGCGFVAKGESVPFFSVVGQFIEQPELVGRWLKMSFSPMDLVFYGIALYEGYKLSFRRITEKEVGELAEGDHS